MVVNLGLLGRLKTQSELAFIMAHEMAHQLLDHVNEATLEAMKRRNDKSLKKRAETYGKLAVLKDIAYDDAKYSTQYRLPMAYLWIGAEHAGLSGLPGKYTYAGSKVQVSLRSLSFQG